MPNIIIVSRNSVHAEDLCDKINCTMHELGISKDAIITILDVRTMICSCPTVAVPYLIVRDTDAGEGKMIAERLSLLGIDVELEIIAGFYPASCSLEEEWLRHSQEQNDHFNALSDEVFGPE